MTTIRLVRIRRVLTRHVGQVSNLTVSRSEGATLRPLVSVLLAVCSLLTNGLRMEAAPPESILSRIQRIDVPAERLKDWPRDAWQGVAVPRAEFDRLLNAAKLSERGPRRVHLTNARYTATLAGETLQEGRVTLNLQRFGDDPVLYPLGEVGLALQDLGWKESPESKTRPAVWGADATGLPWLLADVPLGELTATWSAAGRRLPGEIDFDLVVPAATVSVLELKVPRDRIVRATSEARPIDEGSDAQWQVWRITLGSEHRCRLAITPRDSVRVRKPTILYEYELGAVVREEDLRFQSLFHVEVFDAPVSEMTFSIPASVEVYAVTYDADVPLAWNRPSQTDAAGLVTVQLPGPMQGRLRPIRIDGLAVQKPGQPTVSPQIDIPGGVFSSGRQMLTIVAPIQLRSIRANGFRQQGAVTLAAEGEVFSFRQLLREAQLILDVRRPRASLAAQVVGLLEMGEDSWTLTSEIVWASSSGGGFQTGCQYPSDWEITDVQFVSKQGATRLAGWDVQTQAGGHSLLTVEFLEAIEPGRPHTVKVLARRRAVPIGQSFALPVPQPTNCDLVETTIGLIVPAGLNPLLSEEARLERVSPPEESVIAGLRRRVATRKDTEFWFRGDALEVTGSLQLAARLRPVSATVEVIVEAAPAEYRERFQVRCRSDGVPLDRLLVYLTQPGPEVRWSVLLPRPSELMAVRLPVAQHAEWSYPSSGELWELRLPPLPAGPIEIEGLRSNRWPLSAHPALLFVPQSADRRGRLRLRRPESLELSIDARGLDPQATATDEATRAAIASDSGSAFAVNIWQFDASDDELTIAPRDSTSSREYPAMVSLQLRSLISLNSDGFDLYRARICLENGATQETLRIRLPSPAVLQEATVGGEAIVPNMQGEELLIPGLSAARRDVIELLYRVPARGRAVRDCRRVIVPLVSAIVLGFDWEFALPPSVRLFSEPLGVRLTRPLPQPNWTERLFGPLGQARSETLFNPFAIEAWRELLQPRSIPSTSVGELNGELIAPVEWQVHSASSPAAPGELWLETWHATRTRLLSWIALAVSLSIGIVVRMVGWKYRDRLAAYWLTLLVGIALCSGSPYAEFAGGAIAGTIVALLVPRRALFVRRHHSSLVPGGSTQSFRWGSRSEVALALACGLALGRGWVTGSFAQESPFSTTATPSESARRPNANGGVSSSSNAESLLWSETAETKLAAVRAANAVFVPVNANGLPSNTQPLVYVAPDLWQRLKAAARSAAPSPDWLFGSARYRIVVSNSGSLNLYAQYRIHVLKDAAEQQVVIPIPGAVLAGADSCRVNGQSHPATIAGDGRGFVIALPRSMSSLATTFDVELDLKRVVNQTSNGGGFRSMLPSIVDSKWSLELPEAVAFLELLGGRGASLRSADQRGITLDCGATSQLEAAWSVAAPEVKLGRVEVTSLQVLDVRPSVAELRFRMRCEPLDGPLDSLELDLPKGCLLREGDLRASGLLRTDVLAAADGLSKLRVTFDGPQRKPFHLEGTLLVPAHESNGSVPLPRFGLSRDSGVRVLVKQNWWWIGAATEFRLEAQNLDVDSATTLSAAEFLEAWGDAPPLGRMQVVLQPRDGESPQFAISPQLARRRALRWTQTGRVDKRRLEWTLDALLESTQAPVYQHVLFVDRRLQIESISIRENGAERLIRWSETKQGASPTRVVVFLGDQTTGVQQLILKAGMTLRQGKVVPLPVIRCEEAELVDSRWELFRESDVDVDLILPRGVPAFEEAVDQLDADAPVLVARYQIADPDPKASISASSRHAQCTARTVAVLTKSDTRGWKMTGQIWLTPLGESPRRLGIRFPANAVDPARVRVEHAEATWLDPVDGWRRLDLALPLDPTKVTEVTVSFDIVVEEPTRGDWELPWPAPLQATSHEMCLVASPADVWTPLVGTELKPDESPGWADEFLSERMPDTTAAMYRLEAAPVRLRRQATTAQVDEPLVRLLDHSLWLTPDGGRRGVTRAFLSQTREAIEFDLPAGLNLVALLLDDRPLALPLASPGPLRVPLVGGGRESILVLVWEQAQSLSAPQPPRSAQSERATLPWPTHVKVNRSLVTVLPHRNGWVVGLLDQPQSDWMDAAFDRLDVLLDRQASLVNDPRAAAANRSLIDELQVRVATRLPARAARSSTGLSTRLERWRGIVDAINDLERPAAADKLPLVERPLRPLEEQFVDHPHALRTVATRESPRVGFWLIDRRWLALLLGLLLSLIAIPSLRYLIRLEWGEWLSTRVTVSWLLLGVVWWLYLTPGFFGPLMIALATLRAAIVHGPKKKAQ